MRPVRWLTTAERAEASKPPGYGSSDPARDTARAMSQENVEIVRRAWDAYARGDLGEFVEVIHDEVAVERVHPLPGPPSYEGPTGMRQALETGFMEAEVIQADEFTGTGDLVMVGIRRRGQRKAGKPVEEDRLWGVHKLRDGVIVQLDLYADRDQALDESGLRG
jgi:ketosteroid isomerase-like protein